MFGFLIKREVNDDAVRLNTLSGLAAKRYCHLSFDDACHLVTADFDPKLRHIDKLGCTFDYPGLAHFQFHLDRGLASTHLALSVFGEGKYFGFMLQTGDGGQKWQASVEDGAAYRATGGAKVLIEVMEKKFGVRNFTKLFGHYR